MAATRRARGPSRARSLPHRSQAWRARRPSKARAGRSQPRLDGATAALSANLARLSFRPSCDMFAFQQRSWCERGTGSLPVSPSISLETSPTPPSPPLSSALPTLRPPQPSPAAPTSPSHPQPSHLPPYYPITPDTAPSTTSSTQCTPPPPLSRGSSASNPASSRPSKLCASASAAALALALAWRLQRSTLRRLERHRSKLERGREGGQGLGVRVDVAGTALVVGPGGFPGRSRVMSANWDSEEAGRCGSAELGGEGVRLVAAALRCGLLGAWVVVSEI